MVLQGLGGQPLGWTSSLVKRPCFMLPLWEGKNAPPKMKKPHHCAPPPQLPAPGPLLVWESGSNQGTPRKQLGATVSPPRDPSVHSGLTYILAPGEGQGWMDHPCLLLSGRWLVGIVASLLRGHHIHLRVRMLIWIFIVTVLQMS